MPVLFTVHCPWGPVIRSTTSTMGGVPSGDSCTVMVREEGVEETRDGVGAPGRTGGVCKCVESK